MMNGLDTPAPSAGAHAHQLAKMRVTQKIQSPSTPITPVAPSTPGFISVSHFGEENVMEDLQLAAELGKTLLERNRELEANIKHQHAVIEDQIQEIEYLSKQTAALREVNDSRLRIYEQLEISIHELEKNNQRLAAEGASDKRKIKTLCSNLESLETRCDELQKNLEEARAGAQQQRGRNKRRSIILEEQNFRRSHSCENTTQEEDQDSESQNSEERANEDLETRTRIEELEERLKTCQNEMAGEVRKREELEIQMACMSQENAVLQDQLAVLHEKEITVRTFDEELASLDDASSGRLCRKCLGHVDELASNPTLYDLQDSIEDTDASIESIHGECALIKLKNGGYAWGSQESLASVGQIVSRIGSGGTSPGTEASDAPHNSLLSELDTSYRILIEKYEALLEARELQQQQQQQATQATDLDHEGLVHPGVDDMSGPMSLMMTDTMHDTVVTTKCQRCHTCTCDLKPSVGRPKSNMEEFSEVETSSSGFSDGESRLSNKTTQTEEDTVHREVFDDLTPTPTLSAKCLDLSSPVNPCDKRFQTAPEYKKLFQEIFTVLKKTVDEKDIQNQSSMVPKTPKALEVNTEKASTSNKTSPTIAEDCSTSGETAGPTVSSLEKEESKSSSTEICEPTTDQLSVQCRVSNEEKEIVTITKEFNAIQSSQIPEIKTTSTSLTEDPDLQEKKESQVTPEDQRIVHKPPRPDSLDLGSGSRPSSRQKRRRRHHRIRLDSYQQQLFQGQYQYTHGIQSVNQSHQQGQSSHRHHRRERDSHQHLHQRQQQEDFPTLETQPGEEVSKSRIVYSTRVRCEHHRSRRHRDRSNNSQHSKHQQQDNADQRENSQHEYQKQQTVDSESRGKSTTAKINYPSVEVAKLRKLEMTYAEALKNSINRSFYNRRY